MARGMDLTEKKEEIIQAQEKFRKIVDCSEEREMTCSTTCADVSVLLFKEEKREKDEIVIEEWFALQGCVPAVHDYSAGERIEMLTLLRNEGWQQVLRYFLR